MSIRTTPWPTGVPCWADLNVLDVDAACAFYGAVLGWSFGPPSEEWNGYTVATVDGHDVAGIGSLAHGDTAVWTLYFASDDVHATEAAIGSLGGRVLLPATTFGDVGHLLIALDPTGAAFGVWQPVTHIGAGAVNQPGALTWEDLRTPDPQAARAFYSALFDLTCAEVPGAPDDYRTFALRHEQIPLGGVGGMFGADDMPAHWLIYFGVTDVEAAVTAAERSGGQAPVPELATPYGRMAGLVDPFGGRFWVVENDGSNQPDRSE